MFLILVLTPSRIAKPPMQALTSEPRAEDLKRNNEERGEGKPVRDLQNENATVIKKG